MFEEQRRRKVFLTLLCYSSKDPSIRSDTTPIFKLSILDLRFSALESSGNDDPKGDIDFGFCNYFMLFNIEINYTRSFDFGGLFSIKFF